MAGAAVTVGAIVCSIVGIVLVITDKKPGISCILLGIYPLLQLIAIILSPSSYLQNFKVFCMLSTILASLFMLYADNSDDDKGTNRPLSEVGINKKAGIVTLLARVTYIFSNLHIARTFYFQAEGLPFVQLIGLLLLVGMMACLVVGYRIRVLCLILTMITLYLSLPSLFEVWDVLESEREDYVEATIYLTEFGAQLSSVGGLIRLAIIGGGHYSVDEHLKKL